MYPAWSRDATNGAETNTCPPDPVAYYDFSGDYKLTHHARSSPAKMLLDFDRFTTFLVLGISAARSTKVANGKFSYQLRIDGGVAER